MVHIMARTLAPVPTHDDLVAQELADPAFRAEWERLGVARAVAAIVIGYRSDHGLSQRDLAGRLDVPQPQVARLESGEHEPSNKTLMRLASRLGMEFTISIAPADREPAASTHAGTVTTYEKDQSALRFSATAG
jgi:ribosome-binding protein aMBF1 (putative translation factor)